MFDLQKFEMFDEKIILKYYGKANAVVNYSFKDLLCDSLNLCQNLVEIFNKNVDVKEKNAGLSTNYNVAIILPVHSPALVAAIVG